MQQSNSLDFKLVQRVCLLQQALDQALASLEELTAQVKDKHWIETQLASTEEYANVQQQAIARLKQQLAQFADVQDHLLRVVGFQLNQLIEQQQVTFSQLTIQFQQSHAELQTYLQYLGQNRLASQRLALSSDEYRLTLEAEIMVARSMAVHLSQYLGSAKTHLDHLDADLDTHHLNLGQIIRTIQAMLAELNTLERSPTAAEPIASGAELTVSPSSTAIAPAESEAEGGPSVEELQTHVRRYRCRIQELQAALQNQFEQDTQLRQRYQAIAAERDYYRDELQKLQQTQALPPSVNSGEPDAADLSQGHSPNPLRRRTSRRPPGSSQPIQPLRLSDEAN
ncbi:MAG: hypothetical protein ACFBSG_08740 [Leptolyngbyaceae cyanobacterium]